MHRARGVGGRVSFPDRGDSQLTLHPRCFHFHKQSEQGTYIGLRPVKLRKSTWQAKNKDAVEEKEKEYEKLKRIVSGKL